jgi:hypothetical protein
VAEVKVVRCVLGIEWTPNIIHAIAIKPTESYILQCYRASAVPCRPWYKHTASHMHPKEWTVFVTKMKNCRIQAGEEISPERGEHTCLHPPVAVIHIRGLLIVGLCFPVSMSEYLSTFPSFRQVLLLLPPITVVIVDPLPSIRAESGTQSTTQ